MTNPIPDTMVTADEAAAAAKQYRFMSSIEALHIGKLADTVIALHEALAAANARADAAYREGYDRGLGENAGTMELCELGHNFRYLPDHPTGALGHRVCPHCLMIGRERILAELDAANARADAAEARVDEQRSFKDAAYLERNHLVALLAGSYPSGIKKTAIPGWSEDWHNCVYIDFPWGQASWHYHDSHADLFAHLPQLRAQLQIDGPGQPAVHFLQVGRMKWVRNFRPTLLPDWDNDPEPGITFAIRLMALARVMFWCVTFAAGVATGWWWF